MLPVFIYALGYDCGMTNYQAKLVAPFGVLGIRCDAGALTGIDFLASAERPQSPTDTIAKVVCEQLQSYFDEASFCFDLPLCLSGTVHQTKVWQAMRAISCGQTRHYSELAQQLNSSPRAVGQACGANPIPIVIPCHRVVSKFGVGGFMRQRRGDALDIKRWLLAHEGVLDRAKHSDFASPKLSRMSR